MKDWGVVEEVSHPYAAKWHLVSGQVKEKEGEMAVWDRPGRGGETQRYYWPPIHGLKWTDT